MESHHVCVMHSWTGLAYAVGLAKEIKSSSSETDFTSETDLRTYEICAFMCHIFI